MKVASESQLNISELAEEIKAGKTLVYPTETCYGLGCDGTNNSAVEKIFAIKDRDKRKAAILLFPNKAELQKYAVLDEKFEQKIAPFWPGALTVLLPVRENTSLSSLLISDQKKIACRISAHPFIQKLLAELDVPLVSTSANLAGEANIYSFEQIKKVFAERDPDPDISIDAGTLPETPPTTLIEEINGTIQVLRQGSVVI